MNYLTVLFCLIIGGQLLAQTEDFEDETVGATSFTVDGVVFNMTGDFAITEFTNFSCGRGAVPNKYMDTGYQDGVSSGIIGTIAPADAGPTFILSTSASQCGWTGEADGNNNFDGTIRFTGTKVDNSNISEDIFLVTSIPDIEMTPFTFSSSIWAGVELKSLQFEIVGPVDVDYFAIDNLSFESVLPVEWTSFRALQNPKSIDLLWTTSTETANEKFVVEESQNGITFQPIGEVAGSATASTANDYKYVVDQPRNGLAYYRLKQIDFDGAFNYSNVVVVDFQGAYTQHVQVYPNPNGTGQLNLSYFSESPQVLAVSVIGMAGKTLVRQEQTINLGNNELQLDVSNLTPGVYLMKIAHENGVVSRKVVVE